MSRRLQKADVVADIAKALGAPSPQLSTGSTEPKAIFNLVNDTCGLGISASTKKPDMARAIVEATGEVWLPNYESRGGTVTLSGLIAVREAVAFFQGTAHATSHFGCA